LQWRQDSGTVQTEAMSGAESFLKATGLPFLHGHKISMRNDHFYGDPEYSWDEYTQS